MQLPSWIPFQRKEPVPSPMMGEIALKDPLLYPRGFPTWAPYNPDIFVQRKGGLTIYEKMRRDEQIKSCQWIKRLAVVCSGWQVEPATDEGQDKEVADFCTAVLEKLPGTFEEHVKQILSAMDYGFSITEKIWSYMDSGEFRGKLALSALKTRKPHNWDFDTDEFGNLKPKGLWQLNGQYKYDPRKFMIYSHGKEFDNWYGTSDLQAVYRAWWSKDVIIKFWNIFLERFGAGIPILRPKEGKRIEDPLYTTLKDAIFNLQQSSALAWNVDAPEVDILEAKRRGQSEYDKAINYYDRSISRGLLMPTGLGFVEDDKGGSYARSKKHFDVWLWIMMDLRKTTEELFNEQLIPELVDYNYQVEEYPKLKFMPLEEDETAELGDLWLKALQGKAVHGDAEDEIHFRRLIKFPERDRDELQAEIDEQKEAQPPPFVPGQVMPPQEQEEITLHTSRWHRELTKFEKRVNFSGVQKQLDSLEDETRLRCKGIFLKQRDKLLTTVEKAAGNGISQKWINSLTLQYSVEFQAVMRDFLRTAFEQGRADARAEINQARNRGHQLYLVAIPPREAISMLEKSAFWIKNVLFDTLVKKIQALLLNMLETGETPLETLMKIRAAYDPYVGDEQKVVDQKQIEPYRIETVIRTNATKAYNRAKVVEFVDPELDGFVRAVQLSAILDTRTTDICRSADGKIIMLDDPMLKRFTPPLHYQCRTVLVPVTEIDGEFTPTKQADLARVLEAMPADFGGNVDK